VPETFLVQKVGIDQVVQVGHPMVVRENRARIDQAVVEKEEEEELRLHYRYNVEFFSIAEVEYPSTEPEISPSQI